MLIFFIKKKKKKSAKNTLGMSKDQLNPRLSDSFHFFVCNMWDPWKMRKKEKRKERERERDHIADWEPER